MKSIAVFLFAALLTGCVSTPPLPTIYVSDVETAKRKISLESARTPTNKNSYELRSDASRIYRRIIPAAKNICREVGDLSNSKCTNGWNINIVDSDQFNASASGNNEINLYSGLMRRLNSDEELAFVMAHEIGHHIANHIREDWMNQVIGGLVGGAIAAAIDDENPDLIEAGVEIGGEYGVLKYSRAQEGEADKIATKILARSEFILDDVDNLLAYMGSSGPQRDYSSYGDTHPSGPERLAYFDEFRRQTERPRSSQARSQIANNQADRDLEQVNKTKTANQNKRTSVPRTDNAYSKAVNVTQKTPIKKSAMPKSPKNLSIGVRIARRYDCPDYSTEDWEKKWQCYDLLPGLPLRGPGVLTGTTNKSKPTAFEIYRANYLGSRYFTFKRYNEALPLLAFAAQYGMKTAQAKVGTIYFYGFGRIDPQPTLGIAWLGVATEGYTKKSYKRTLDHIWEKVPRHERPRLERITQSFVANYGSKQHGTTCRKKFKRGGKQAPFKCYFSDQRYGDIVDYPYEQVEQYSQKLPNTETTAYIKEIWSWYDRVYNSDIDEEPKTSVASVNQRNNIGTSKRQGNSNQRSNSEDLLIEQSIIKAISGLNLSHDSTDIRVVSFNGLVLLTGRTQNTEMGNEIERQVRKIPNVRKIHNELSIQNPVVTPTKKNDEWITNKLKEAINAESKFIPADYQFVTYDGVVYLLGIVTQNVGHALTEIPRNIIGVKKVVKVFEYLD